jgi:superfamily I DNA and/or RNA helicase
VIKVSITTNVKKLLTYLLSIKNMDEEVIRNINEYEKLFWDNDLKNNYKLLEEKDEEEHYWFCIDKSNKSMYDEFFQLYTLNQRDDENHEIIWANYILTWDKEDKKIVHPLVTTKLELSFDAVNARFFLKPYDCKMKMEIDIFGGINIANINDILKIKEEVENSNLDFRNLEDVSNILNKISHYLSSNISEGGEIQNTIGKSDNFKITQCPIIYNSPLVIVRKSDHRLWHNELVNTLRLIDEGYPIPPTVTSIVSSDKVKEDIKTKAEWADLGKEILFPLPSNEEQKEVVRRLSEDFGLVVEGPPGTGKSQTIVNLICHLLAHGKRILITSQTGRALRVLSEKIPQEIKPLCISILGDDTKSLRNIDESLRVITENLSVDPNALKKEIITLKKELDSCKKRQVELCEKLSEAEAIESNKVNVDGNLLSLIDIAKWVKKNEEDFAWIEDNIRFDSKCPLTDEEFSNLINLLDSFDEDDYIQVNRFKKVLNQMPDYSEICENIAKFKDIDENHEDCINYLKDWSISYNHKLDYSKIINTLTKAEKQMDKIEGSWLKKVMNDYYNSEIIRPVLKHLYMRSNIYIKDLSEIQRRLTVHNIIISNEKPFETFEKDFFFIYEHIKKNDHISNFFKRTHKNYKYIFDNCFVDDKPIIQRQEAEIVKLYIKKKKLEKDFMKLWNTSMKGYESFEVKEFNINSMMVLEECIKGLSIVVDWNMDIKSKIINYMGNITFLDSMDWYEKKTYTYLKNIVISLKKLNEYLKVKAYILNVKKLCHGHDYFHTLENAIDEMNLKEIKDAYKEVDRLKLMIGPAEEIEAYLNKIRDKAPKLLSKLMSGKDRSEFKNFNKAWNISRFKSLLGKANNIRSELVEKLLKEEELRESILIEKIVSKKAWYKQIQNTTDLQKKSLYAWLQAAKRIGRGRSKFADKYRDIAQREMESCKDSIPVWIMPLNKIIENIKLNNNPFDVIIFDESSQCDIFSICALFRAKRAVVVGDDKQISPQLVGVDQGVINNLINKHLTEIPHCECFDLETSLYNTALRSFPKRLLLKEHFRCLPEIIGFSNKLCYSNEIIPLRYNYGLNGLGAPIKFIKVTNGQKDRIKNINIEEAKLIGEKVSECCKDNKYNGMTMGVISLLGDAQAELIEGIIREKIGENEMLNRRIVCGDAYSFQGDERDIIFLSMVVGDNIKFTALTRDVDIRRFNVAVSRAKNQVWLFSSINEENLNPDCVRTKLLRYCLNPGMNNENIDEEPKVYKSTFHKNVFKMIKEKGYKITACEELKCYNVDFVVEGSKNKIAIVCNGSKQEDEDFKTKHEKRMTLERVGWTFYKINESEFYTSSEKAMEGLWIKLNFLGIEKIIA